MLAFFATRASNAATETANVQITSCRRAAGASGNTESYAARIELYAAQPHSLPTTTRIKPYTRTAVQPTSMGRTRFSGRDGAGEHGVLDEEQLEAANDGD